MNVTINNNWNINDYNKFNHTLEDLKQCEILSKEYIIINEKIVNPIDLKISNSFEIHLDLSKSLKFKDFNIISNAKFIEVFINENSNIDRYIKTYRGSNHLSNSNSIYQLFSTIISFNDFQLTSIYNYIIKLKFTSLKYINNSIKNDVHSEIYSSIFINKICLNGINVLINESNTKLQNYNNDNTIDLNNKSSTQSHNNDNIIDELSNITSLIDIKSTSNTETLNLSDLPDNLINIFHQAVDERVNLLLEPLVNEIKQLKVEINDIKNKL